MIFGIRCESSPFHCKCCSVDVRHWLWELVKRIHVYKHIYYRYNNIKCMHTHTYIYMYIYIHTCICNRVIIKTINADHFLWSANSEFKTTLIIECSIWWHISCSEMYKNIYEYKIIYMPATKKKKHTSVHGDNEDNMLDDNFSARLCRRNLHENYINSVHEGVLSWCCEIIW